MTSTGGGADTDWYSRICYQLLGELRYETLAFRIIPWYSPVMERNSIVSDQRSPGRPRSEEAHDAILTAAVALIREVGYDAVTMEGIAARAGVGKATVYRRWKSREALVVEAVGQIVAAAPDPDTGRVEEDLMRLMHSTLAMYADPASAALLSGLVAAMARSEPIAHAVRTGFVGMRLAAMRRALERGIARGELRAETDVELWLRKR